jgi:hypothetical protein
MMRLDTLICDVETGTSKSRRRNCNGKRMQEGIIEEAQGEMNN